MTERTVDAVLFDKDGTLLDFHRTWAPAVYKAAEEVAELYGQPQQVPGLLQIGGYDSEHQRFAADSVFVRGSNANIAQQWAIHLGVADSHQILLTIIRVFRQSVVQALPVPGLEATLALLQEHGLALGVASMDDESIVRQILEQWGLLDRFCFICGADSGYGVKPGTGMLNGFCDHTGIAAEQVAVVGDSVNDLRMGRCGGAGITVGVLTGPASRAELTPWADAVIDNVAAIDNVLGTSKNQLR